MNTIEKAKAYDEALERAKQIRNGNPSSGTAIVVCEQIFPELKESEDEQTRQSLVFLVRWAKTFSESGVTPEIEERMLAYLEKQKELEKEELAYRLNGLMQDYIKEGKDDEEKEHRLKCYKLFWDALEDTSYFEQKEQKPVDEQFEEWLNAWYQGSKELGGNVVMSEEEFKNWSRGIKNMYDKPAWSEEDIEAFVKSYSDSLPMCGEFQSYHDALVHAYRQGVVNTLKSLRPSWKPSEDEEMDKECIELCEVLNSIPSVETFESCCGHLKDRYSIWFFSDSIDVISRLGRCVERNYSDGKWELLVDSTDTHPTGVFWLRSKMPFQSYDEMNESIKGLCNSIQHWFNTEFDSYFNGNSNK